ncbi:hypothetical protein Syun_000688 [Stephania yunnanensis]|uniref:Uncharacterized protein n=1 Tax=Stephania yunnanensis TaxID=152371 RepID=A0AAP0Q6C9_9MAGN
MWHPFIGGQHIDNVTHTHTHQFFSLPVAKCQLLTLSKRVMQAISTNPVLPCRQANKCTTAKPNSLTPQLPIDAPRGTSSAFVLCNIRMIEPNQLPIPVHHVSASHPNQHVTSSGPANRRAPRQLLCRK